MTKSTARAGTKKPPVKRGAARQPKSPAVKETLKPVSQKLMAEALRLTPRRIRQLLQEGVLIANGRSEYDLAENFARFNEHKLKEQAAKLAPTSSTSKLQERREEQLARRMAREDRKTIDLEEALYTTDRMGGMYLQTISGLPSRLTRDVAERKRIEAICDNVRDELAASFDKERTSLRTGLPVGEVLEEDDA